MSNAFRRLIHFDELVPRILRNVGYLVSGTTAVSLIGIMTLVLTARALGPAGLGILALVEAYVRTIDMLFRLQPTQVLIKYGSEALEKDDKGRFERLIKLSILIDLAGGVLAGLIAISVGWLAAPVFGLGPDGFDYILVVALALFVSFRPTGVALLRLFDRFGLLAVSECCLAVMRLAIAAVALAFDLGIWAFIVMLLLHSLADGIVAFALAIRELLRRGYDGVWRASARTACTENTRIFRFLWNSNIYQILRNATQRFDVLALGVMVSPAIVGQYQVAKRSGRAVLRLARTLTQVLFPELAKLWIQGERSRFRRMVRYVTLMIFVSSSAVAIPLAFAVPSLVDAFFGEDFTGAIPMIWVLGGAIVLNVTGLAFNAALLSMGRDRELLHVTILSTALFAVAFVPAVSLWGGVGAMLCQVLFSAVWFLGCLWHLEMRPLPEKSAV
ncbi:lipopolysaccharide biosynthesis protein [Ruegeria arenilitoris]|uniref:lipopolysaccharide biosynthesis protein n=1 Tax=Ruegeria arenilitoris TaxID=1173585 RepID=UPI00266EF15B|nr:oligosaccharide flippase family protein [Ruegeria arenilitoris]